jgi:hypothetical protein
MITQAFRFRCRISFKILISILVVSFFIKPQALRAGGILTSSDLLPPGQCKVFRHAQIKLNHSADPDAAARTLHRLMIQRANSGIPETVITDSAFPDTPVLVPFPPRMSKELRDIRKIKAKIALKNPAEVDYLKGILGDAYFIDADESPKGKKPFPEMSFLLERLGSAQSELRKSKAKVLEQLDEADRGKTADHLVFGLEADPDHSRSVDAQILLRSKGVPDADVRELFEAEARVGRLRYLMALRDYFESRLSAKDAQSRADDLSKRIGFLSGVLGDSVIEHTLGITIPVVGRRVSMVKADPEGPLGSIRALWYASFNILNGILPDIIKYDEGDGNSHMNRISAFGRELSNLPENFHELSIEDQRAFLLNAIRRSKVIHVAGYPLQSVLAHLEEKGFLTPEIMIEIKEVAVNPKHSGWQDLITRIQIEFPEDLRSEWGALEGGNKRFITFIKHLARFPDDPTRLTAEDRKRRLSDAIRQSGIHQVRYSPEQLLDTFMSRGVPRDEHLLACRRLTNTEQNFEERLTQIEDENSVSLRFLTNTWIERYVTHAAELGIDGTSASSWRDHTAIVSQIETALIAGLEVDFPRLFEDDFRAWALNCIPPRKTISAKATQIEFLSTLSYRPEDLLRGRAIKERGNSTRSAKAQTFLEFGEILYHLNDKKRDLLRYQRVGDKAEIQRLNDELEAAGVTREQIINVVGKFYSSEELEAKLPEQPVDIEPVLRQVLFGELIKALAKYLESHELASDPVLQRVSQTAMVTLSLMEAKERLVRLNAMQYFREVYEAYYVRDEILGRIEASRTARQDASVSDSGFKGVVDQYISINFNSAHPGLMIPKDTQTVLLWLHGMGTDRSNVTTLDQAVGMSHKLGQGVYGVGVSGPWHGGPNIPLGEHGLVTPEVLREVIKHLHHQVQYYKELGVKVVVSGRSAMGSVLMQYLVEHPGNLDGAIAYSHVLPKGYPIGTLDPEGRLEDQLARNIRLAMSNAALRARQNEVLGNIATGLIEQTDWVQRLENEPWLLDQTPTLAIFGGRDQEYAGMLPQIIGTHRKLIRRGAKMTALLFPEGAHQLYNPRSQPTDAERNDPNFDINDYNGAFAAVWELTRLFLKDPERFSLDALRAATGKSLDPLNMPSEHLFNPR